MYSYEWDSSTGGYILTPTPLTFSKEPRPVYYKELDILGFDKYWIYDKNDAYPYMWAEANNYYYRGRLVAKTKGGSIYTAPELVLLEDPEPEGYPLRFVDIPAMIEKNRDILEQLVQDTIKKIYNTLHTVMSSCTSAGADTNLPYIQCDIVVYNYYILGIYFVEVGSFPDTLSAEVHKCLRF